MDTKLSEGKHEITELGDDWTKITNDKPVIRLDIACGQRKENGWTGMDVAATSGVDIVHDVLSFPWPFADSSVQEARCSHFVEHIPMREVDGKDLLIRFMEEIYRVMVPNGLLHIVHPYGLSARAFQDPTHRRFLVEGSWLYFNKAWMRDQKLDHYNIEADFEILSMPKHMNPSLKGKSDEAVLWAQAHYVNSIFDLTVMLRAKK